MKKMKPNVYFGKSFVGNMIYFYICLAFIAVYLVGCGTDLVDTPMNIIQPTVTLTYESPQYQTLPSTTATVVAPHTLTPLPIALTPTQLLGVARETKLRQLLQTNENCSYGCIFGIKLNETTEEDLKKALFPIFGNVPERKLSDSSSQYEYLFKIDYLQSMVIFKTKNKVVNYMEFHLMFLDNSKITQEEWSGFSLKNILQTYGEPNGIKFGMIGPSIEPVANPGYGFSYALFYDSLNTVIQYSRRTPLKKQTNYHLCLLTEPYENMTITISPYSFAFDNGITPAGVTSLTIKNFYELFTKENNPCIDLSGNALIKK